VKETVGADKAPASRPPSPAAPTHQHALRQRNAVGEAAAKGVEQAGAQRQQLPHLIV
jgi:hypothetical protein